MKVTIPDVDTVGKEQEIVNWARTNCKSYVTMEPSLLSSKPCMWELNFYFSDEEDASWFMLRWS